MALLIEFSPDVEARLAEAAKAQGLDLPGYAARLLKEAATREGGTLRSPQNVERFIAAMAERAEHLPNLPAESFSRKSFYRQTD